MCTYFDNKVCQDTVFIQANAWSTKTEVQKFQYNFTVTTDRLQKLYTADTTALKSYISLVSSHHLNYTTFPGEANPTPVHFQLISTL